MVNLIYRRKVVGHIPSNKIQACSKLQLSFPHSCNKSLLYSKIIKKNSVVFSAVLYILWPTEGTRAWVVLLFSFTSLVLNKRQGARKCTSQSAAALHLRRTRGQSQSCFHRNSGVRQLGESRLCSKLCEG